MSASLTAIPFDPAASLYRASVPAGISPVSAASLPAYQRALLVADGTVTRLIEAWALEPVKVHRLGQAKVADADPFERAWLELDEPEDVAIRRAVFLAGRTSGQFFLYATSLIVASRLPPAVRHELDASREGLGQIIAAGGMESRREGLWFGRERISDLPAPVAAQCDGDCLTRCYRLLAGGRPVMLITERFPWGKVPATQR